MTNEARYRALLDALRKATKAFDAAEDDGARLDSVVAAVRGVNLCLLSDAEVVKEGLIRPLSVAENVLQDARQGASPAILKHSPTGPKPAGTTHERVQASLAWALELLTGPGKLGTDRAAAWVAEEARKRRLTDAHGMVVKKSQINQWRKDFRSGRGPTWASQLWEVYRREYASLIRMPPSDLKSERAQQEAMKLVHVTAESAPRSAPKVPRPN